MLKKKFNDVPRLLAYILLFLMLAFPMVLPLLYIKTLLFLLLIFTVIIMTLKEERLYLHPYIILLTLFQVALTLLFSFIGLVNGAPGALKQAQVYAFWPLIYMLIISGAAAIKNDIFPNLYKILILSTVFIGMYGCIFVLEELKIIPHFINLNFFNEEKIGFSLNDGYIEINFMGLNSLPYLIPFTMAALVVGNSEDSPFTFSRGWLWVALIFGLAVVIASGRRAILLVTILAPVFILLFSYFQPRRICQDSGRNILSLILIVAGLILILLFFLNLNYDINLSSIYNMFLEGFDFGSSTNESASIRRDQFFALLNGWFDSPLLGAGHGASAPGYIRDSEMPWAYELSYLALLYQVGIVGVLIYALGIIWIYYMAIKIITRGGYYGQIMMPLLVGLSCYLVANATNPYLARFDGIWPIFLPIGLINRWLLHQKQNQKHNDFDKLLFHDRIGSQY
jgi:hypothetical protein